jgi:release factor glutamine methyltransferase
MSKKISLGSWLSQAKQEMNAQIEQPGLVAEVLAAHHLGQSRTWVLAHPEHVLEAGSKSRMDTSLGRVLNGEPLPYILGKWEFFGLSFSVSRATLIPRPETEKLVEIAIDWLQQHPGRRSGVDVGTGSGCIAISLAYHIPDLRIIACDISSGALRVASENIQTYSLQDRVHLVAGDLLEACDVTFDLICANLPYIPIERLDQLQVSKNEPRLALDGGEDGTEVISVLIRDAVNKLSSGGLFLMEMDESHAQTLREYAKTYFPCGKIEVFNDQSGKPRILRIEN